MKAVRFSRFGRASEMAERRSDVINHLRAFGADVVLVEVENLRMQVADAIGNGQVKLGIDAVAGTSTRQLASCVADGGTVINYGLLSGSACEVDASDLIFRDIRLIGFWYSRWLSSAPSAQVQVMHARLAGMLARKQLRVPVEATYPAERLTDALFHAQRAGRHGKVVLRWGDERRDCAG
jgi:NADPH:quinone reductase-like Zn-dependent oxidoreductase